MKRGKNRYYILLLILGLSIGFAYLSATLYINGNANIRGNKWDIHLENLNVTAGSIEATTAPVINEARDTVTYSVMLEEPGDFYEFTVDAKNGGTLDGKLSSFTTTALTTDQAKYLNYTITYADGVKVKQGEYLRAGAKVTYKVRIEYKEDPEVIPGEDVEATSFDFTVNFSKSDKKQYFEIVSQSDPTQLSVGDEVSIGTEHFNVLSSDSTTTKLLAKYNLYVGTTDQWDYGVLQNLIDINDNSYCLQSDLTLADHVNYSRNYIGVVEFSKKEYWLNKPNEKNFKGASLKEEYGSSFPVDIYDSLYDASPDYNVRVQTSHIVGTDEYETNYYLDVTNDNYSIAYYVNQYHGILKRLGISNNSSARILLLSDLSSVETTYDEEYEEDMYPEEYFFLYNTSYWLGTTEQWRARYNMDGSGYYIITDSPIMDKTGVRPLIEVPTSEIIG